MYENGKHEHRDCHSHSLRKDVLRALPIGFVEFFGPWSKVFLEEKNGDEAEQEEQGNWKKETTEKCSSEAKATRERAPIEVIDASVPPVPVTLHPERSSTPEAHRQSIPDAKANFSFPKRVAASKKMDSARARRTKAIFVAHCSK